MDYNESNDWLTKPQNSANFNEDVQGLKPAQCLKMKYM